MVSVPKNLQRLFPIIKGRDQGGTKKKDPLFISARFPTPLVSCFRTTSKFSKGSSCWNLASRSYVATLTYLVLLFQLPS